MNFEWLAEVLSVTVAEPQVVEQQEAGPSKNPWIVRQTPTPAILARHRDQNFRNR